MAEENIDCLEQINDREIKLKKISKNKLKEEAELKSKIIQLEEGVLRKDQEIQQLRKGLSDKGKEGVCVVGEGTDSFELTVRPHHTTTTSLPVSTLVGLEELATFLRREGH